MKLNSFRTTLLTAMSAVLICGAPVLSLAQCVPGSGVNQAQLSSQNWTPRLTADLNSIRFNAGSYNETLYPMGNIISIAPDEDNFALLDQRGLVWQVSSKVESGALGANRFYQPAGSNVQPQAGAIAGGTQFESDARLINAGGVMWVARPSAKGLVPLVACSLNTNRSHFRLQAQPGLQRAPDRWLCDLRRDVRRLELLVHYAGRGRCSK